MLAKLKAHATNWKAHIKSLLAIAFGGGALSVLNILTDPAKIAEYTAADWRRLKYAATGGAVIALIHLWIPAPQPPPASQPPAGGQP